MMPSVSNVNPMSPPLVAVSVTSRYANPNRIANVEMLTRYRESLIVV